MYLSHSLSNLSLFRFSGYPSRSNPSLKTVLHCYISVHSFSGFAVFPQFSFDFATFPAFQRTKVFPERDQSSRQNLDKVSGSSFKSLSLMAFKNIAFQLCFQPRCKPKFIVFIVLASPPKVLRLKIWKYICIGDVLLLGAFPIFFFFVMLLHFFLVSSKFY